MVGCRDIAELLLDHSTKSRRVWRRSSALERAFRILAGATGAQTRGLLRDRQAF
jgi:hypothetical protein